MRSSAEQVHAHPETKKFRWYDGGVDDAERRIERARWPDGPRCPACGSDDVTGPGPRRRCRACRLPFRWSTQTALHATKLQASDWIRAVHLDPSAAAVAAALGCSAPTARRVTALIQGTELPRGCPPEARLRALLSQQAPAPRRSRASRASPAAPRVGSAARQRLQHEVGSLTRSEKLVINALRHRPFGATAHTVAGLSTVSAGHTRRCLRKIESLGWAKCRIDARAWGYKQTRLRMWGLTWSGSCAEMLALVTAEPTRPAPQRFVDMVPPEFWFNFWSGTPADDLRISSDGLLIAETLIGGRDPAARMWALAELPVEVLQKCRELRGCDSGPNAADIDAAIASRHGRHRRLR